MADDVAPGDGDVSKSTPETESAEVSREDRETEAIAAELDSADAEPESTPVEEDKREEGVADRADGDDPDPAEGDAEDYDEEAAPSKPRMSHLRLAAIAGLVVVVALAGLTGWTGFRAYKAYQGEKQRELFLQVGRQGAINLTTIDWEHAEADVQRVLDSATGTFYDDFQNRSAPFVEVVKQAQSKSVGTISEAGLESASSDEAKVLVAVSVNTSNLGAPQQEPRAWRMRLTVTKVGDDAKVSNVEFVP